MMLVRTLVNALALLAVSLLPDIEFVEPTVLRVLLVAVALGILNSFIKPIVQFLTLPYYYNETLTRTIERLSAGLIIGQ